jgi:hypothetical protein
MYLGFRLTAVHYMPYVSLIRADLSSMRSPVISKVSGGCYHSQVCQRKHGLVMQGGVYLVLVSCAATSNILTTPGNTAG